MFDPAQAAKVTVATLVLVGGETPEPFKGSGEAVAAAVPDARVATLEGLVQAAEMFAPQVVAEALLDLLREQR